MRVDDIDFLSVSFGYQPELWAFWQACGFRLVRIGSHREASSGCYSAMAILPISEEGRQLVTRAEWRLAQECPALHRIILSLWRCRCSCR
ncbi:MAG: GNAT family N-acetyltransferase [Symbiopectobacterium sp.]